MTSEHYGLEEERQRRLAVPRVVKAKELPWEGGPGHWNKDVLRPSMEPFRTQTLEIHIEAEAPGGLSHIHGHQNEALLYVPVGLVHLSIGQEAWPPTSATSSAARTACA